MRDDEKKRERGRERCKREIDLGYYTYRRGANTYRKNSTHPSRRSLTDRLIASHTYRGEKHLRGRLPLAEMLARDGVRRGIRDNAS